MAKKTADGSVQMVRFGEIAFAHDVINRIVRKNRRSKDERELLRHLLARDGWLIEKGTIICFGKDSPIWGKLYEDCLETEFEARKTLVAGLKTEESPQNQAKQDVLRETGILNENGQILRPKFLATCCTGRGEQFLDAMFDRKFGWTYNKETYSSRPVVGEVPVQFRVFLSEVERVRCQINENDKSTGQTEPTSLDKLRTVQYMYANAGWTQTQAREEFNGTTGQKAWLLCRLDSLWSKTNQYERFPDEPERPDLDLVERCFLSPKAKDRYISFTAFGTDSISQFTELIDRSSPKDLEKRNNRIAKANEKAESEGKPTSPLVTPATTEEVEDFISKREKGGKKVGFNKENWENFQSGKSGSVLQDVAAAQLSGNAELIKPLTEHKDVFNRVHALVKQGISDEKILYALAVMNHPQFDLFAEWALNNKPFQLVEIVNNLNEVKP